MEILEFIVNKDGSGTMTYTLNDTETAHLKELARMRKKKFDDNFINKFMLNAIDDMIKGNKIQYGGDVKMGKCGTGKKGKKK